MLRPPRPKRKLPAALEGRLAGGALRAARKAAQAGNCLLAEGLFLHGNLTLQLAAARMRSARGTLKLLDAGEEAIGTAAAIAECWERHGTSENPT